MPVWLGDPLRALVDLFWWVLIAQIGSAAWLRSNIAVWKSSVGRIEASLRHLQSECLIAMHRNLADWCYMETGEKHHARLATQVLPKSHMQPMATYWRARAYLRTVRWSFASVNEPFLLFLMLPFAWIAGWVLSFSWADRVMILQVPLMEASRWLSLTAIGGSVVMLILVVSFWGVEQTAKEFSRKQRVRIGLSEEPSDDGPN